MKMYMVIHLVFEDEEGSRAQQNAAEPLPFCEPVRRRLRVDVEHDARLEGQYSHVGIVQRAIFVWLIVIGSEETILKEQREKLRRKSSERRRGERERDGRELYHNSLTRLVFVDQYLKYSHLGCAPQR